MLPLYVNEPQTARTEEAAPLLAQEVAIIAKSESISEVKNTASLSLNHQLRTYLDFARQSGLRFDLYTTSSTALSGPLRDAIDSGLINHSYIPQ